MVIPASETVMSMNSIIIPDNPLDNAELSMANSPRFSDFSFGTGFQLSNHILKKDDKYDN